MEATLRGLPDLSASAHGLPCEARRHENGTSHAELRNLIKMLSRLSWYGVRWRRSGKQEPTTSSTYQSIFCITQSFLSVFPAQNSFSPTFPNPILR